MSEDIALAAADRAAELAAIRSRAARASIGSVPPGNDVYVAQAWRLRELVQAEHDRRTLLARLDDATAAADAALAEYARYANEIHLLRELHADVERWRESGGDPRDLGDVLETADRVAAARAAVEGKRQKVKGKRQEEYL